MAAAANPVLQLLSHGKAAIGATVRSARTVEIATILKTCGFDWMLIDLEHGAMSLDTASEMATAALSAGIAPIARVPKGEYTMATRLLDNGAWGIVMPHVDSAEEAAEIVAHLRYPPMGHRSIGYPLPQFAFEAVPSAVVTQELNREVLLLAMIESPAAVAQASKIAAVGGIDGLLIGTNDLCLEMGIPGEVGHEKIVAAYEAVINACKAAGKWPAMGGVYQEALLRRYVGMGMRLIIGGSDLSFLMESARARSQLIRQSTA
jgi:4-hydroxy-2-oxoheptanedioate aldolase